MTRTVLVMQKEHNMLNNEFLALYLLATAKIVQ